MARAVGGRRVGCCTRHGGGDGLIMEGVEGREDVPNVAWWALGLIPLEGLVLVG